jgi:outer membrane protein assembly factor BamB
VSLLSTARKLLFAGDGSGNLVTLDPASGNPLWHTNLGNSVTNGPITCELDGTQYLVVAAGDTLFAFAMLRQPGRVTMFAGQGPVQACPRKRLAFDILFDHGSPASARPGP